MCGWDAYGIYRAQRPRSVTEQRAEDRVKGELAAACHRARRALVERGARRLGDLSAFAGGRLASRRRAARGARLGAAADPGPAGAPARLVRPS